MATSEPGPSEDGDRVQQCIGALPTYDSPSGAKELRKDGLDFLRWGNQHKSVAVSSVAVPDFILPEPYSGTLHDLRVFCKRRGPDDAVYDAHEDLRQRLARGNAVLELRDGPEEGRLTVLRALRKFTGGEAWDDDDRCDAGAAGDASTWQRYFAAPVSKAARLVSTRKANGEAAHLSALRVDGQWLLVCGSKNTHLLVRDAADVDRYGAERFRVARIFAHAICVMVASLDDEARQRLLDFLWRHSLTAVFEILMKDHQHVEDLSEFDGPRLKFITWTHNQPSDSFTALPMDVGLEFAKQLGLDPVSHECFTPDQLTAQANKILRTHGHEGAVLYFLDAEDRTIGLLKKKTAWYVLCRALREKAKSSLAALRRSGNQFSLSAQQQKAEKRLGEIEAWLQLPPDVTRRWTALATNFLAFVVRGMQAGELSQDQVANLFPVVWGRFLRESGENDRVFE